MKNLMNCAKNAIICVVMVFVLLFNSVTSAHAVTLEAGIAIASFCYTVLRDAVTDEEKSEAIEILESLWRSSPNGVSYIEVTADELQSLYVELNGMGFPCRITNRYIAGQWCFCIEGTGYVEVLPDSYFWFHGYEESNISGDVFTNLEGWAYVSNVPMTSNEYIKYIYNEFGAYIDGIEESLDLVYYRLTKIYDFITGYTDAAGNQPGTNLYDKIDEVVTAIEGISGSAANFDTTPITDKLQEVISSADANFSALLTDLSMNTDRIVNAIPDPVDLSAVNSRIDAVVEEVQKISTFADLHEVVTVTPGVLGDVDVVTTGEWRYEGLTFYYEPSGASKTFSPDTNMGYWTFEGGTAVSGGALDLSLYGSYDAVSVTLGSQTLYALNNQGSYGTPCDLTVTVYFNDGSSQEVSVFDLYADADHTVLMVAPDGTQITHAMCYFPSGTDNQEWYMDYGTDPFVFTLGNMVASPADSLSFTADGVPHTLYWSNEYEFSDGCYEGDFIFYDDGHWFKENVNSSGGGVPLYYYDTYLTDALTGSPTSTTTMEGETYTWFEWFYTSYKGGGAVDVTPIVNKLKDIENALSNMGSTIDIENNTNININEGDENYNIFYVDDPDGGEDKSIVDLSGDTLTVFGKLLNFLYKVGFKGALDNAGGGIGDLSDFYLDTSEGSADLWVS